MNFEELRRFYDDEARRWGDSARTAQYVSRGNFRLLQRNIFKWTRSRRRLKILDAGCGTGLFSAPLVRRHEVHGVDFSEESLRFAARHGLRAVRADLAQLPYENSVFDLVLCIGVWQHLHDSRMVLRELSRVTHPGGLVVVATINRDSLQRRALSHLWHPPVAETLRAYTASELKSDYESCGLRDVEFLHLYYPLPYTTRRRTAGWLQEYFSSTVVIRGRKPLG
jgi:2-polyprenyl-3-methyl-5-hydroxy-6-metoxy-1,4-benzoquinol methylase